MESLLLDLRDRNIHDLESQDGAVVREFRAVYFGDKSADTHGM